MWPTSTQSFQLFDFKKGKLESWAYTVKQDFSDVVGDGVALQ